MAKYTVSQQSVSVILGWIESDNIAIPEMQRPFVWNSTKVRDLMDSQSQAVPVKGGGHAGFQQILIDGQQRTTALRAAVAGGWAICRYKAAKRRSDRKVPMHKKLAAVITAGALGLSGIAAAPASAEQKYNFTPPVARTPSNQYPGTANTGTPAKTTAKTTAANADSGSSSTVGTAIGVLVFGALFLAIYGWFSPYHPNGAWANAAR